MCLPAPNLQLVFGSDHTLRLAQMLVDKIDATMEELHRGEGARNRARFLRMRAEGKTYWLVDQGKLFWLTKLEAADRRAEASTMVPAMIEYEDEDQKRGTEWKKASVDDIEGMLAAGKAIVLHNC